MFEKNEISHIFGTKYETYLTLGFEPAPCRFGIFHKGVSRKNFGPKVQNFSEICRVLAVSGEKCKKSIAYTWVRARHLWLQNLFILANGWLKFKQSSLQKNQRRVRKPRKEWSDSKQEKKENSLEKSGTFLLQKLQLKNASKYKSQIRTSLKVLRFSKNALSDGFIDFYRVHNRFSLNLLPWISQYSRISILLQIQLKFEVF